MTEQVSLAKVAAKMGKPDCYKCKNRTWATYGGHSQCTFGGSLIEAAKAFTDRKIYVVGNMHGINNGWANWPFDFDPLWIDRCSGFEEISK